MSRRTRRAAPRALVIVVALLALFGFTMSQASVAIAQEASPVASACEAPALPPGTPTPMEASPVAEHDMSQMGTPEAAVAEATPVEEAAPEGTPANQATTDEVTAAVDNIINCINGGNYEGMLALTTTNGMVESFFTDNPYDVLAAGYLEGLVLADVVISDVQTYADGRFSAQVDYMQLEYQFVSERWWMVQEEGYWKYDGFVTLIPQPEGDTAVVGVTMTEYAFAPNVTSVVQSEVLVLHGINAGVEPHEMVVARLPEGVTVDQWLADPSLQEQIEVVGRGFWVPGQQGDIAMLGLEPGVYTLVCFLPGPDGQPHAALGMHTELEVTASEPVEPVASPAA